MNLVFGFLCVFYIIISWSSALTGALVFQIIKKRVPHENCFCVLPIRTSSFTFYVFVAFSNLRFFTLLLGVNFDHVFTLYFVEPRRQ